MFPSNVHPKIKLKFANKNKKKPLNTSTPTNTIWTSDKTVLIWYYLSFRHDSQYLRYPTHEQFDPMMRKRFDLQSDGIGHTSHNDCDRSIRIYTFVIASSIYELFDHPTHLISMGIRDGKMSYVHSPNGHAM